MNTSHDAIKSSSSRSSNLFTRMNLPFGGNPRNISSFTIELEDPTRTYSAGDSVKGSIQCIIHRSIRITHLVLTLHGFAKVYKNPTPPGEGIPSEVKTPKLLRGRQGVQYLGNGLVSFLEREKVLCGEGKVAAGRYSFIFDMEFPMRQLPSSLDVSFTQARETLLFFFFL
jgi:arrestin-related trafficking adapter 9